MYGREAIGDVDKVFHWSAACMDGQQLASSFFDIESNEYMRL